ncbi:MAG: hypothetical protein JRI68_10385 [Deltaproteobacteria bacterium]|nr:hypothetical protein [Deltaproteobacteria bacterium]
MIRPLLCLAVLLLALVPAVASAQTAADVAAARELFIEGAELAKAGRWAEARQRYERSLALKHAAMTLYSLGVAQMSTGELVAALESFRAFLREPGSEASEPYRQPATDAIAELDQRVGRVTIHVEPAGVAGLDVTLDGQSVPVAALGRPRLVDPGSHALSATAPGYDRAAQEFLVAEGGSEKIAVTLPVAALPLQPPPALPPSPPPAPAPAPLPPRDTVSDQPSDFPILPVLLMGGGGALLAVGVGVGVAGLSQANDAPASDGEEANGARTKALVADVLGGAGIVAVVVGVIWLIVDDDEPTPTGGLSSRSVRPWAAGEVGGLTVRF